MWFSVHDPEVPDSVAEAEDEAARAEARAQAARARAEQLRRAAESADTVASAQRRPRWLPRPRRKALIGGAAILLGCASLGTSGYMLWQHHVVTHKRQLAPEYAAAARHAIETMMSIDPQHAKEDIQRIIDVSTGDLKSQLAASSSLMAKQAEESKVVSKVKVGAVAVESVTDNSAVVLVTAKSDVTNPDNTKRPPALWRLAVSISRDDGQLKMSKVEFLQ